MSGVTDPGPARSAAVRALEFLFLLVVCGATFFPGLGRHGFIKTEALRAIVVAEMLERPGVTLPTVHHRPYVNKPPLYAWSTTYLARAVGRFDEEVARVPSALCATMLVLLLYSVAERWIGGGAGFAAAVLALANVTVLDYGVRAELDIGFTFFTTVAILLVWPALRCSGGRSFIAWLGVYGAVLLAAMWKAPHSLIFLWLLLLLYGRVRRDRRWLKNPGQWFGLAVTLVVLIGWAAVLSAHAGPGSVGRIAGIELFKRLVPYHPKHWLSVLWFVPVLAVITLPASVFVLAGFRDGAVTEYAAGRDAGARGWKRLGAAILVRARLWWRAVAADPFAEFLSCWLVSSIVFMAVVPAKSPRYALPVFPAVFLLAAWVLHQIRPGHAAPKGAAHVALGWRCIYGVIGVVGLAALMVGVALAVRPDAMPQAVNQSNPLVWLIAGGAWVAAAAVEFLPATGDRNPRRLLGLVIVVLGSQVVVKGAWWPLRVQSDSQREAAAGVADHLAPDEPVFVLGGREFFDTAYYCTHSFYGLTSPEEASQHWNGATAHFLLLEKGFPDLLRSGGEGYRIVYRFLRDKKPLILVKGPMPP